MVVIMVDAGETVLVNPPYYKVNDERLCRSTQWVVSLNTALSPSSCVVIQEEEYNHTLGSLTPLILVPHPVRTPEVAVVRSSGRAVARSAKWMNGFSRPAWDPAHIVCGCTGTSAGLPCGFPSNRRLSRLERSCGRSVVATSSPVPA